MRPGSATRGIILLSSMYNRSLAQKHDRDLQKLSNQQRRAAKWNQRYKTQVMPELLNKFNRRINGFLKKMQDDPVVLPPTATKHGDQLLLRQFDGKLNISPNTFNLRNSADWRSFYPPIEKERRSLVLKQYAEKNMDATMAFRSLFAQSKYSPNKPEYRSREKDKEINPAMRYASRNSQSNFRALPDIKSRRKFKTEGKEPRRRNPEESSQVSIREDRGDSALSSAEGQNSSFDAIGPTSLFLRKKDFPEKTELQIIQEEELKMLAQNKLYFKSLANLELQEKALREKNLVREVLEKCGVKKAHGQSIKQTEIDNFHRFFSQPDPEQ